MAEVALQKCFADAIVDRDFHDLPFKKSIERSVIDVRMNRISQIGSFRDGSKT